MYESISVMSRLTRCSVYAVTVFLFGGLILFKEIRTSEFPERECCDPVYPPPLPTAPSTSAATPTGRSGPNIKTAVAILNCLLARQLCFEDASCSAILEIIPRVCGPELVACSTVTVTKCKAALRTLQAFPFFKPTCLCREPHVDPECNSFRDFLFDHPCVFVLKKEKDPYPVDALPTCNHALSVCQQERKCIKLFEDFKTNCKVRENKCRMEDRELCHEAWTNLRLSPMFGCICPNNHMKRRCDRIFTMVNHNPCVDVLPVSFDLSGTDSALYPYDPEMGYFKHFWYPPTNLYPYFLFPPTSRPRMPLAFASHSPALGTYRTPRTDTGTGTGTSTWIDSDLHDLEALPEPPEHPEHPEHPESSLSFVKVMSPENGSSMDADFAIESQVENPLVDSQGPMGHGWGHGALGQSPAIQLSAHGGHVAGVDGLRRHFNGSYIDEEANRITAPRSHGHKASTQIGANDAEKSDLNFELSRITFQSTCHTALNSCNNNGTCRTALQPVLLNCDMSRCSRNACMEALQAFYRTPDLSWSLEIAFCLCKKTENKQDACMIAQEKLHPVCAQRQESSTGAAALPVPTCHSLAEYCREDKECKGRLEFYEQSCAVDSVTKKCAGPASECRAAMLGILGTELRSSCACKGTDLSQLYDCLGWQRLLWVNPCVVESQKDFHIRRLEEQAARMTTTSTLPPIIPVTLPELTPLHATPMTLTEESVKQRTEKLPPTPPPPEHKIELGGFGVMKGFEVYPKATTTTVTTTVEVTTPTTTTTTIPPRFCVVQRPYQSDQYIREGKSKRLYREDEPECSELCHCGLGESLSCHTLCVERVPCRTDFAFYSHSAPAYQAYRGRCVCYSGRFICMRPLPGEYSLPRGVFLFLGYSSTDEALLRPHTNLSVLDAVRSLQEFVRQHIDNETSCSLVLFNVTNENVILVGRVPDDSTASPKTVLDREKAQCSHLLQDISEKVNSQNFELSSHLLLSIFKMAEVEVVSPEVNSVSPTCSSKSVFILNLFVTFLVLVFNICDAPERNFVAHLT